MKCAVIYGDSSDQHQHFIEAGKTYFDTVLGVPLDNVRFVYNDGTHLMYKQTDLCSFDCVFLRLFGSDLLFGEHVPEILQEHGVYTQMDGDSLAIASNKFYSMKILAGSVPVPGSAYTLSTEETERVAAALGYPAVIKLISGYGGKGVMKADTPGGLSPIIDTLTLFEQDICLQRFIENPGEDIRIVVIGEDTYSYKRVGGQEEWRSNISGGGHREAIDAPDEMREAAVQAAKLCGFDFCGVDIIENDDGFFIGEINASPGVNGTDDVLGINMADRVMEHMQEQTITHQTR